LHNPQSIPRVLGSDHWHHTPGWPSAKEIISQFKSLPPTATPATLQGTTPPRETGWRQDPCSHAPELIPSSSRLRSLASYPRLALCQTNPLPIQIPPTYSHSRHPTGDHSSQETGSRQDPCSHAPELIPSSFGLRSLTSYPRLAFCQRNHLPIQIPHTYSHSRHPTGDHSSQGNRFQTRPMFTCTRADPLEF